MTQDFQPKIFILGANGFIGAELQKELFAQGRAENIKVFQGDILDKESIRQSLTPNDVAINLVGSFQEDVYAINVLGSANLLEACREVKMKKVIFASSGLVYGENQGKPFDESIQPRPISDYALSKYLAEQIYQFYSSNHNIPAVILRFSNVYGPNQGKGAFYHFISAVKQGREIKVCGDGRQQRDFVNVADAAKAIVKAIDFQPKTYDIFNIAGEKPYSLLEVISLIEQAVGSRLKVNLEQCPVSGVQRLHLNDQKARTVLGYQPQTSLTQGIYELLSLSK